jgi:hypothetical protein
MHPTLERLTQAKFLGGGFGDTTWPSDAVNDYVCDKAQCYETDAVSGSAWPTDSVDDYVCDKAQCYESTYGAKGYYALCCYGHYENDQMLDFVNGNKNSGYGLTNRQVLDYTDPTSSAYQMTYVYDHFKWEHCEEDFAGEIESLLSEDEKEMSTHQPSPAP